MLTKCFSATWTTFQQQVNSSEDLRSTQWKVPNSNCLSSVEQDMAKRVVLPTVKGFIERNEETHEANQHTYVQSYRPPSGNMWWKSKRNQTGKSSKVSYTRSMRVQGHILWLALYPGNVHGLVTTLVKLAKNIGYQNTNG